MFIENSVLHSIDWNEIIKAFASKKAGKKYKLVILESVILFLFFYVILISSVILNVTH